MKYSNIIAGVLFMLGFLILFFIDFLISKDTQNEFLLLIKKNNLVIGIACIGAGYYVYSLEKKSTPITESLPSYEEATSTDEILNM
jgi:uncharacterized membrane protein